MKKLLEMITKKGRINSNNNNNNNNEMFVDKTQSTLSVTKIKKTC